jgi:hypothetical protein
VKVRPRFYAMVPAFVIAASVPAHAAPCATGGFTLICRGHFQMQNEGDDPSSKDITFTRSPLAAGPTGSTLTPGTCAWEDRPVGIGEPSRVHYAISATRPGNQGWFTLVSQCAFDDRCTVEICVKYDGTGILQTITDHAVVRFPF